ncbi:NCS2 family permease [Agrococcus jejuensis]|uniref:Putative MFS transporter, AGZA family, xanthine/uracil permease n=1 Tax=Agrococcus jejuensis TaxID=399736 RepID=A0A1G8G667_9MICO|nr:NCS2 family permease [Agrococcus jejuensis]SDH89865.1 putative MFS transporter, AGZA family, xanthine/uracil permease [Agrococcus jejuensis]
MARTAIAGRLDGYFKIRERGSTIPQEVRGGLVTFFAMAYIIVLNPLIIGGFSIDQAAVDVEGGWLPNGQVAAVTALIGGLMTIAMGVVANVPFGLAAGLGINSFLAFTLVGELTWPEAMGLVVINGVLIVVLSVTGLRRRIFDAIPAELKSAIAVGVGLFIAFIGFVDSGFVRATGNPSPPLQLGEGGSIVSLPTGMFLLGVVLMGILVARKVRGALLIGIVATTAVAIVLEAIFQVGPSLGQDPNAWNLNEPVLPTTLLALPDLSLVGQVDPFGAFARIGPVAASMLVFTLFFLNFFDAMGSMTGLAKQAGIAAPDGTFPGLKRALIVEGVGAVAGGGASASSNTVFIDSAAGIGEGARTGLASVVTGVLFLAAMFLTPLTQVVPLEVAAATLVIVGALMMSQIREIDFSDFRVALPAFLTIVVMPLTYNIANGIGVGFIAWVLVHAVSGRAKTISPLLWIVAGLFVVFFVRGPIEALLGL